MKTLYLLILAAVVPFGATAQEEEILPTGFPVTRYAPVWENSPFEREVVKPEVKTIVSDFGKDLVLEGLINDNVVGPIAYMRDLKENMPLVVTSQKSADDKNPYTIVSANQTHDPELTKVTITDGTEQAEIGYQANITTQAIATPRALAPQPNQPDQPKEGRNTPRERPDVPGRNPTNNNNANTANANRPAPPVPQPTRPEVADPITDSLDAEPRRRRILLPGDSAPANASEAD